MKTLTSTIATFRIFLFSFVLGFLFLSMASNAHSKNVTHSTTAVRSEIAQNFANQMAYQFMKQLHPNTGFGSYGVVKGGTYNSYTDEYIIDIETYWTGKTWAMGVQGTCEVDGKLVVKSNGRIVNFTQTYENRQVSVTKSNNSWFTAFAVAGVYLALTSDR